MTAKNDTAVDEAKGRELLAKAAEARPRSHHSTLCFCVVCEDYTAFIAAAPELLRAAYAEIERLRAQVNALADPCSPGFDAAASWQRGQLSAENTHLRGQLAEANARIDAALAVADYYRETKGAAVCRLPVVTRLDAALTAQQTSQETKK